MIGFLQTALSFVLVLGIGVFLFAMRWDSSDPARVTRRSDVAFWLHLLAAPMIRLTSPAVAVEMSISLVRNRLGWLASTRPLSVSAPP